MADKTTLNGALEELGKLMATNLTTQGVASSYTEGLTTLAGKILDIQGGGGVRTLSLTSDKDILSYYDSESALLTATLLEDGSGCEGETVTFKADGVSIGSDTTDSNGVATLSYNSQGVGDVSLSASVGTLSSETYSIRDVGYFNPLTENTNGFTLNGTLSRTFSNDGVTIKGTRNTEDTLSFDESIPSVCIIECDVNGMVLGTYDVSAEVFVDNTAIANRKANGINYTTLYTKTDNTFTNYTRHNPPFHLTIEKTNTNISYSIDNVLLGSRTSDASNTLGLRAYNNRGITIKNLIIHPL